MSALWLHCLLLAVIDGESAATATAQQPRPHPLVGFWVPKGVPGGAQLAPMVIGANGSLSIITKGGAFTYKYRLVEEGLIEMVADGKGELRRIKVRVIQDELDWDSLKFRRLNK